jgi:hypothetical protein
VNTLIMLLAASCMVGAAIFAVREGSQLRKINRMLAKIVKDMQSGAVFNPPWQPIATAPMNLEVLISDGQYVYCALCRYRGGEPDEDWVFGFLAWVRHGGALNKPTHWMPLPEPPK